MILTPGKTTLDDWRAIYRGASVSLDPACRIDIANSARAVERIIAGDAAVYGINTGFGKLATVRIAHEDLAQLQHNIVVSHAAGTGAPMPAPVVRLMLALKLASYGYVLETGSIRLAGEAETLGATSSIVEAYLGA